jgi:hypothetical protein
MPVDRVKVAASKPALFAEGVVSDTLKNCLNRTVPL